MTTLTTNANSDFFAKNTISALAQLPKNCLTSNQEPVEKIVEEEKALALVRTQSESEVAVEMASFERRKEKKAQKPKKVLSASLATELEEASIRSEELALSLARQIFEQARLELRIKEKLERELGKKEGASLFKEHLAPLGELGKTLKGLCCVRQLYEKLPKDVQNLVWENLGRYTWDEWKRLLQLPEKPLLAAIVAKKPLNSAEIKNLSDSYVTKKFPSGLRLTRHHLDRAHLAYSELSSALKWDSLLQKINELAGDGDEYTEHLFEALESFGLAPDKVRQTKRSSPGQKIQELNSLLEQQKQDTSSKLDEIAKLIKHLQQENLWLKQQFNSINNNSAFEKSAVA